MKTKLDIVIHAGGLPFNGETVRQRSLGGSESAAYYQARELAKRGHRVMLFTSEEKGGDWDGVRYEWHGPTTEAAPLGDKFTFYAMHTPHDVLIIQRHPLAFHKDWASKINIHQLHDVALYRQTAYALGGLPRIDFTTGVSRFHAEQIKEVYGLGDEAVRVVPNGVDPDLYPEKISGPHPTCEGLHADDKFVMLYQSRPERGLEHLLRPDGIMAKLVKTNAHLLVCGYDHVAPQMKPYYDQLAVWGQQLPNVTYLGSLPKPELALLQRGCDLLFYPTEFAEVSCITAMEAMHAGLPILSSNFGALPETCKGAGAVLVDLVGTAKSDPLDQLIGGRADQVVDEDAFVRRVQGLMNDKGKLARLKGKQLEAAKTRTWAHAVDELEKIIEEGFARRRRPDATLRHLIEHSDIKAAQIFLGQRDMLEAINPTAITQKSIDELSTMYGFANINGDPENGGSAIREHYEYWEGLNCDQLAKVGSHANEIERFTMTSRFRGVLQYVARQIREAKARAQLEYADAMTQYRLQVAEATSQADATAAAPAFLPEPQLREVRVLEFGCAHGHLIIPLAKIFPDVEFLGVDFMARSVKMAYESAAALGISNVSFGQRDQKTLDDDSLGVFDCVIAAEVLEHVYDYQATLRVLAKRTTPSGSIVTTTPCGRWEWSGRPAWRHGRQHLHHFEIHDLAEIFSDWEFDRDQSVMYAPVEGSDGTGFQLGSWVCSFKPWRADGTLGELHDPDYQRKFDYLAPRQLVSLTLIAKDAEPTLRKALLATLFWVDEVVIGLDKATTDHTRDVITQLSSEFPQVPFKVLDIESPVVTGFAAARNATVDAACGDWILWQDADEELPGARNLQRLLRPSAFNAYACPQIHYAIEPPQVLTTDFPCRLFRNDRGVRFYGVVHEHPEDEPGEAIARTMLINDIKFLHGGYVDEATRQARYQRNLPLLVRDLQENPDRFLNKYLWLRDLAQGIGFEAHMRQGAVSEDMKERAREGIKTFGALLELKKPIMRMLVDSLPYYSLCVEVLGVHGAFDAKVNLGFARVATPGVAAQTECQGRFADRATYLKFINLIVTESTKCYESRYA